MVKNPKTYKKNEASLMQYVLYFIKQQLSPDFSAEDIMQEVFLTILENEKIRNQLGKYLETNTMPTGKDLSFLKAIIFRTRLRIIYAENKAITSHGKVSRFKLNLGLMNGIADVKHIANGALDGVYETKSADEANII